MASGPCQRLPSSSMSIKLQGELSSSVIKRCAAGFLESLSTKVKMASLSHHFTSELKLRTMAHLSSQTIVKDDKFIGL